MSRRPAHRRTAAPDARPRLRVALVGADGAGKSTISRMLEEEHELLPFPVKRVYMGVNLEASTLMLPTTRLLLAVKRARGGRPDLVAAPQVRSTPDAGRPDLRRRARAGARLAVWLLEEWLRQAVATGYSRRGFVVVFDRHFFADYYHSDVARGSDGGRSFHGWVLEHLYPKPDLVVCLDAPAEVLFARKPEATPGWLDQRRRQYLALEGVVPAFVAVDATRPLDEVYSDVLDSIRAQWKDQVA
ncbi:MAG TPA: hypothetical protein VFZ64_10875 [Nocardioidaceae bacterium]